MSDDSVAVGPNSRGYKIPHDTAMRRHRDAAGQAVRNDVSTPTLILGVLCAAKGWSLPGIAGYALAQQLGDLIDQWDGKSSLTVTARYRCPACGTVGTEPHERGGDECRLMLEERGHKERT